MSLRKPCNSRDGLVLVRKKQNDRVLPTCLRPRHIRPIPGVIVWRAICYESRSILLVIPRNLTLNLYVGLIIHPVLLLFVSSIQDGVLQQNSAHPPTAVVTQLILQLVNMLLWPARSRDLSTNE